MSVCVVDFDEFAEFLGARGVHVATSALEGLASSADTWIFRESERVDVGELSLVASVMETSGGKGVLIEDGSGRLAGVLGEKVARIPASVVSDFGALARLCGINIESEPATPDIPVTPSDSPVETAESLPEARPHEDTLESPVSFTEPSEGGFVTVDDSPIEDIPRGFTEPAPAPVIANDEPVTNDNDITPEETPRDDIPRGFATAPSPMGGFSLSSEVHNTPTVATPTQEEEMVDSTEEDDFDESVLEEVHTPAPTGGFATSPSSNTPVTAPTPTTGTIPTIFSHEPPTQPTKSIRDIIAPTYTGNEKIRLNLPTRTYSRILLVTGAKGGIGKTTLSVAIAQTLATKTAPRTILIDGNRGQGDTSARLHTHPRFSTIYDYANGKPFEEVCLDPSKVIRQDNDGNPYYTLPTHVPKFSYIQAPRKGTSNSNIVTARTYANIIQEAFTRNVDYIVIDTQIAEDSDTSGLFDQLWLPLLQKGAYTTTLTSTDQASARNTWHTINDWVKNYHVNPANIYPIITFTENWDAQAIDAIKAQFRKAGTPVLGMVVNSPSLKQAQTKGDLLANHPDLAPTVGLILERFTGDRAYRVAPSNQSKGGLFSRFRK